MRPGVLKYKVRAAIAVKVGYDSPEYAEYQRMRINIWSNIIDAIECRPVSRCDLCRRGIPREAAPEIVVIAVCDLSWTWAAKTVGVASRQMDIVPGKAWLQRFVRPSWGRVSTDQVPLASTVLV